MKPVVYIDVLFLLNFIINSVLFLLTGIILRESIRIPRLIGVSFIASLYAVCVFIPSIEILVGGAGKIFFSAVLIRLLFGRRKIGKLIKDTLIFLLMSFGLAGTAFAGFFLTGIGTRVGAVFSGGTLYLNVNMSLLVISVVVFYGITVMFSENCRIVFARGDMIKDAILRKGDKKVKLRVLIDTGCHLKEPVSGRPVIIVPPDVGHRVFECSIDFKSVIERGDTLEDFVEKGIKVIPFFTVKGEWEMMMGLEADELVIEEKIFKKKDFLVGISGGELAHDFDGIINPEIFIGGRLNEVDKKVLAST